jgi:hypothetical protein
MLGLLSTGDPNAPSGKDDSTDPLSAHGNMWGDSIGDSFGAGGLGLAADGGHGEGIGIGSVGTGQGFGSGNGRLGGAHRTNPPRIKMGATTVQGRLPPEVIQRIVRQNFGRFRFCYENGLRTNPKLEGTVTVHFVIESSGVVGGVSTAKGTDVKDKGMTKCLENAFTALSFPKPEAGKVTVDHPILFSPPDPVPAPAPAAKAPPATTPPAAPAAPGSP